MRSQHSRGACASPHPNAELHAGGTTGLGDARTAPTERRRAGRVALFVVGVLLVTGTATPHAFADGGVDQAKQKVAQLAAALNAMQDRLEQLDQLHAGALDRMDALDAQIAQQQADLQAQQAVLDQLTAQLSTIAVDRFAGATSAATDNPLFSSASAFSEDVQRSELTRVAYDQGAGTTDDLTKALADLDHSRAVLEQFKAQQATLASSLQQQIDQGNALQTQIIAQQQTAQQQYGDAVAAEQERQAQAAATAAAAKARRDAEAAAAAAVAAANAAGQHSMAMPTQKPRGSGGTTTGTGSSTGDATGGTGTSGATSTHSTPTTAPKHTPSTGSGSSGSGGSGSGGSGAGGAGSGGSSPAGASGANDGGASTPATEAAPATTEAPATTDPAPKVPPPSSRADIAVAAAKGQLGTPYIAYMSEPGVGFDCSGLTKWVWGQAGVDLPHQSGQQFASLPHVPLDQLQPGDLLFYGNPIHHVAIYIGGGEMIDAPAPGKVVRTAPANFATIVGAARPG